MFALCIDKPDRKAPLQLRELPESMLGPDEVRIRVACSSANWSDVQKRHGVYPTPVAYPLIPGLEVSGVIEAVGSDVGQLVPGQRVAAMAAPRNCGGFAETCVAAARYVFPIPESVSMAQATAFPIVCLTAWHLLNTAYHVTPGEKVLVHAIGGGVGLMLTQMARAGGATVFGTVGSPAKAHRAKAFGAAAVFDRSHQNFVEEVRLATDGVGVDLVIDSIGGDVLDKSFDAVKKFGRVINIGEAGGYPDFDIREAVYRRSSSFSGFELLHAVSVTDHHSQVVRSVLEQVVSGSLRVPVERVFKLSEATEMLDLLESRQVNGKLVLQVAPIS